MFLFSVDTKPDTINVDEIIMTILNIGNIGKTFEAVIHFEKLCGLLSSASQIFKQQGSMLEIEAPVKICGDVHGQFSDVLRLFDRGGFPPLVNYLFLGDYVDRGPQSLETVSLFMAYKVKFPGNFFLLRGNHECGAINRVYGFLDEVQRKYGSKFGTVMWNNFQAVFAWMPYTALVSGKILCMHGGISKRMSSLNQLRNLKRPILDIPNPSLEIDILWADPDNLVRGFDESTRGVGMVFGDEALQDTMEKLGVDLIARAHQVVQDGYEFFHKKRLVTIFSAPHYCGEFDNAAAMMNVDKNLTCSFQVMRPVKRAEVEEKGK
uniref:Serine/threonine-protein phosphatase n=1 Tax=Caenorhabditis japonica TaxID=281687 RepID=A0A8R1E432_CAEJA